MKETRKFYRFNDRNSKGERIKVEFVKVENDYKEHLINVWYKKGFIKERLKSYWHVTVYVYDEKGACWGRYNPQILPGGTKINFDWVLEATEENKERILHEIIKRAYGGTKHEKKRMSETDRDLMIQIRDVYRKYNADGEYLSLSIMGNP